MRRAEQWILREIAGESILVPTGSAAILAKILTAIKNIV